MAYKGQMVHYWYRGTCNPAIIVDFWEEDTIARLQAFQPGGPTTHARVLQGAYGEDEHWHALPDCEMIDPAELGGANREVSDGERRRGEAAAGVAEAIHFGGTAGDTGRGGRKGQRRFPPGPDSADSDTGTGPRSGPERGADSNDLDGSASADGDVAGVSGRGGAGDGAGPGDGTTVLGEQQGPEEGGDEEVA